MIEHSLQGLAGVTVNSASGAEALGKPWFVYLVRAANGALYCGISDNPERRFAQHQRGRGARFFSSSPATALVYVESWPSKSEALRHERLIKRLRKSAKEHLVASFTPITRMHEP